MAKITEFVELTDDELKARKRDFRQEFLNLRLQQQTGQLKNPSRLRELRRGIARIETLISQRRLGLKVQYKSQQKEGRK